MNKQETITLTDYCAEKQLPEQAARAFRKYTYRLTRGLERAKRNTRFERAVLDSVYNAWTYCRNTSIIEHQAMTAQDAISAAIPTTNSEETASRAHVVLVICAVMAVSAACGFVLASFL